MTTLLMCSVGMPPFFENKYALLSFLLPVGRSWACWATQSAESHACSTSVSVLGRPVMGTLTLFFCACCLLAGAGRARPPRVQDHMHARPRGHAHRVHREVRAGAGHPCEGGGGGWGGEGGGRKGQETTQPCSPYPQRSEGWGRVRGGRGQGRVITGLYCI